MGRIKFSLGLDLGDFLGQIHSKLFSGCFDKIIHTPCLRSGDDVIEALKGLEGNVSPSQLGKFSPPFYPFLISVDLKNVFFSRYNPSKYFKPKTDCSNKTINSFRWCRRDNFSARKIRRKNNSTFRRR